MRSMEDVFKSYMDTLPELKVRYHKELFPDIPEIKFSEKGNFVDLYIPEEITLKAGEFKAINLGISVQCPEGYWMQIVARSSTFSKFGIIMANAFGVLDTSYCGDNDMIFIPVYATRDIVIPKHARISQFRLVKDICFNMTEVESLAGNEDRGGLGSTGI